MVHRESLGCLWYNFFQSALHPIYVSKPSWIPGAHFRKKRTDGLWYILGVKKQFPYLDHRVFSLNRSRAGAFTEPFGILSRKLRCIYQEICCRHLGCLTSRGLVQRRHGGGGGALFLPLPLPLPIFPLNAYSLGKYFFAPILHNNQIQDGGLI